MADQYDAIIIGSGQAGNPLAHALAGAGWETAIVEREHVGGTCINEGCTPTKTMVASARVAHLARRAADYGVHVSEQAGDGVSVDLDKVQVRKREVVESFREGNRSRLQNAEYVDLIDGDAHFVDTKEIEVKLNAGGTRRLRADKIFINVGARPSFPPIDGLDELVKKGPESGRVLNSTTMMETDVIPPHLIIVGGGYIGVEFGQMFRRFGSEVTLIQRGDQLLTREDADVADAVAEILREEGIDVRLNAGAQRVRQNGDGELVLTVKDKASGEERDLTGSHLLIAAGRQPNTDSLGLAEIGIKLDKRGHVETNDRLETNVEGIYALGDVKGGPAFTHIAYDDYRIIQTNLLEDGDTSTRTSISGRLVPYTVFMDPQLGRVGLSEREAREQGRDVRVAKMPMSHVARAIEVDETRGLMKAVVEAETDQILGVAVLGIEGGELMSLLQVAMMGNLPYTALRDGIFSHPTLAESLNNLFTMWQGEA